MPKCSAWISRHSRRSRAATPIGSKRWIIFSTSSASSASSCASSASLGTTSSGASALEHEVALLVQVAEHERRRTGARPRRMSLMRTCHSTWSTRSSVLVAWLRSWAARRSRVRAARHRRLHRVVLDVALPVDLRGLLVGPVRDAVARLSSSADRVGVARLDVVAVRVAARIARRRLRPRACPRARGSRAALGARSRPAPCATSAAS